MLRCLDWSAWFCTSVGLAFLVIGLALVPQSGIFADEEYEPTAAPPCSGDFACDSGCTLCPIPVPPIPNQRCIGIGCTCTAVPPPGNTCAACDCLLNFSLTGCHCM